jgi:hypothetical protein
MIYISLQGYEKKKRKKINKLNEKGFKFGARITLSSKGS